MPPAPPPDRSRRVVLLGALALAAGVAGVGLGALHPLAAWLAPGSVDWRSAWMGLLTWAPLGAVVAWAGLGALRLRRWSRPVMLVLAWTWLIVGAVSAAWVVWSASDLVVLATASLESATPPVVLAAVRWGLIVGTVGAGVLLPGVLAWGFSGEDVRATLARVDPAPAWTDACPMPVLGLALGLWLAALVTLPLAVRPAVPFFGRLLTGPAGVAAVVLGGAAAVWLGLDVYRLRRRGWWATSCALALLGVSTVWTLARVGMLDVYRALGYPDDYVSAMAGTALARPGPTIAATIIVTLLSLAYMAAIRDAFPARR